MTNIDATGMTPLLSAVALRKSYGKSGTDFPVLRGIDLAICPGELLVILGNSGSGKSTLLNMLGGMDKPTSGSVYWRGEDITLYNEKNIARYRRTAVGFIFQSYNLIHELTARENVELTAPACTGPYEIDEALLSVGMKEMGDKYPSELSGGEQQRISIARTLVRKPDFFLCDEPTGALDYNTGKQVLSLIEGLSREHGKTVVFVTHTREIARMADRVVVIRDGLVASLEQNSHPVSASSVSW